VTGISCTVCAVAIENQVKKIEGVDDVKTAIMLNKVFMTMTQLSPTQLQSEKQ
jgi:copper chaperone CopZ